MDILTIPTVQDRRSMELAASQPRLRHGFAGQDMFVIPRPTIANAIHHALFRSLYPTDIGWYPEARYHFRERPTGARQDHIMLCVGGHGYVVVNGVENHLKAGNLLIIPQGTKILLTSSSGTPGPLSLTSITVLLRRFSLARSSIRALKSRAGTALRMIPRNSSGARPQC